jgi:hypothetical protein
MRTLIAALTFAGLLAFPAFAQSSAGTARDVTVRECSVLAAPYRQPTWGNMDIHQYRTCMAQHGQVE